MTPEAIVKVYVSNTPHWRDRALAFLEARGVSYVLRNVVADHRAMSDLIALTGQQRIPTLVRGGAFVAGFDESAWGALLER